MKSLSNFLNYVASPKSLVFFIVLYITFPVYFLANAEKNIYALAGKEIGIIDLTFGFNPQKTLDMVAEYGEAARHYYAQVQMTVDVAYPITYAFLFGIILSLLFRKKAYAWVNVLPFLTLLFDFIENSQIVLLLYNFPQQSYPIAVCCEIFKLLKWLSVGSFILLILYGLVIKLSNQKSAAKSS